MTPQLLGDFFSESFHKPKKADISQVVVGSIFRIILSEDDGLVLNDSESTRLKYILIIGFDENNDAGVVLINSEINTRVHENRGSSMFLHYPLSQERYPFLDHYSYINCNRILKRQLKISKILNEGEFITSMCSTEMSNILRMIKDSIANSPKLKRRLKIEQELNKQLGAK